jgi:hypothetical protein
MTISPVLDPEVETEVEKSRRRPRKSLSPKFPRTCARNRELFWKRSSRATRIFSPTLPTRRSFPSFG